MADSVTILEYKGPVDHKVINQILKKLKKSDSYLKLDRTTSKRAYSVLVECLENISKHSDGTIRERKLTPSYISVSRTVFKVFIKAGNLVSEEKARQLCDRLDRINGMDDDELHRLYDDMINRKTDRNGNGAGLGFMLMKFKSGNPVEYSLFKTESSSLLFELRIKINKYVMRKLIIEPTISSPRVVLDPEKQTFEISGESRPADVATFYEEIISWMNDYSNFVTRSHEYADPVTFNLDFEYFNSSSAKYILDFCKQISDVRAKGKTISVNWHYDDDDIDMLEVGREMSRMSKFPFEYIPRKAR
jgi:hypothetical protein